MGIIVLAVAVLPLLGVGGMQMYRAETPGPVKDAKLTPRITETAKAAVAGLCRHHRGLHRWRCGAPACRRSMRICHAFSVHVAGRLLDPRRQHRLFRFAADRVRADRLHAGGGDEFLHALRGLAPRRPGRLPPRSGGALGAGLARRQHRCCCTSWSAAAGVYPTASATPCGTWPSPRCRWRPPPASSRADFALWPVFAPMWMLFLSCVIRQHRLHRRRHQAVPRADPDQAVRSARCSLLVHPQAVAPLKIAGQVVPNRVGLLGAGVHLRVLHDRRGADLRAAGHGHGFHQRLHGDRSPRSTTPARASAQVGPPTNYGSLSDLQTWICTLAMFLGRIELFTFLVLFTPTFWRK